MLLINEITELRIEVKKADTLLKKARNKQKMAEMRAKTENKAGGET